MSQETLRRAADMLLHARQSGLALAELPAELMPATVDEAYAVQDLVTREIGTIGGWKTAPAKNGEPFNWAPIPAAGIFADGAEIPLQAWPRAMLELEIGLLMGRDLPDREEPYSREEVTAAVAEVRVCMEIFASRYADYTARGALEKLADAQNAAGAVVGTGLKNWQSLDLGRTGLTLDYGGKRHESAGGESLDRLLDACTLLANGARRLGGLKAGQIVITGARIGPIAAAGTGAARGAIEPVGTVDAIFV